MFPSLLERYLLTRLARAGLAALLLLTALYLAFDLGDQGRRLAHELGWAPVLYAALLRWPLIAAQLMPAALLLGGALAVARLQRDQELQALRALGLSTARLARAVAALGVIAAASMLLLIEGIAPRAEATADALRDHRRPSPLLGRIPRGPWRRADGGWLLRQGASSLALRVVDGQIIERHDGLRGRADGGLVAGRSLRFSRRGVERVARQTVMLDATPAALGAGQGAVAPRPETLTSTQLARRITQLRRQGQSERPERLLLHLRRAYLGVTLAAALVLFGLLDGRPRSQTRLLGRATAWIGLLWALVAGGFSAGQAGLTEPWLAAWLPCALALLLGASALRWRGRAP